MEEDLRVCGWCGKSLAGRYPHAKYCSPQCNTNAQNAKKRAAKIAERQGRTCDQCGGPIAPEVTARARFCSPDCRTRWFNTRAIQAKSARLRAARAVRPPCANPACGKPIPVERHAGAIFCSHDCQRDAARGRWLRSAPGYMRMYLYGVTPEQWEAKMAEQGGRCGICRTDKWRGKDNAPHLDHPEGAPRGVWRGILSDACNQGLGRFDHDPIRLLVAARWMLTAAASDDGMAHHCDDLNLLGDALRALAGGDPALLRAAADCLEAARDNST